MRRPSDEAARGAAPAVLVMSDMVVVLLVAPGGSGPYHFPSPRRGEVARAAGR
ncbi:hypothetical protein ACO2RV_06985 [Ancylobacter sp. VNQ12]|uniref:hypothetical protein n=1 Tax=Ancylobacter sp. VNQ12 TaxID=3400920 RepID=UPI003C07A2D4